MKLIAFLIGIGLFALIDNSAFALSCYGISKAECCRVYANLANRQFRASTSLGCGYGGPRYQDNYTAHYRWCTSVSESMMLSEDRARRIEIRSCLQRAPRSMNDCNTYALRAIQQYNANVNLGCFYQGARWQDDFGNHEGWCRGASEAARMSEDSARRTSLLLCLNR